MADIGIPMFGVSICTIPFEESLDLEAMRTLIADFTTFKHQFLEGEVDAAFPDYFIEMIKPDLEVEGFDDTIIATYRETTPLSSREKGSRRKSKKVDTLMKTEITYKIGDLDVVLSKSEDQTTWLFDDLKPQLLGNGKQFYTGQDLQIEASLKSFVGDGTPLKPDEEVAYNYEQNGGFIQIESAKVLNSLLFS